MKNFFTFGDSFPAGLVKPTNSDYKFITPFGEYIASELGLRFINKGLPGNNIPSIAAEIIQHTFTEQDLVMVVWSGLLRPRCWNGERYAVCSNAHNKVINLLDPTEELPTKQNDREALLMSEFSIRATINFLRDKKVNFKMIGGFIHPPFIDLECTPEWIGNGNTLMDICTYSWGKRTQDLPVNFNHMMYEKTPLLEVCMHPNEDGHREIAKKLLPFFKE